MALLLACASGQGADDAARATASPPSPWETGGALRVIAQAQQWPTAFRDVGLVAKNPGATVQALTRLWLTGTVRGTRLNLELER